MPTPNTADAMKRHKAGKAGFTDKAHLKAKGLIPRADGTKKVSPKYEDLDAQPQDKDVKKVKGTQPKKYYKTLDKDTKKKRAAFFKKKAGSYKKSDGNKDYKAAPGDAKAKTKPSTFTTKYKKMYGEDAPANATGTAVVGTGDDSSTVVMKKKKDKETMKDRLLRRFKIKETIDRTVPDLEKPKDEIKEKVKQLKAMAMTRSRFRRGNQRSTK